VPGSLVSLVWNFVAENGFSVATVCAGGTEAQADKITPIATTGTHCLIITSPLAEIVRATLQHPADCELR